MYYVAKQCSQRCTPEEYAIALAKHYVGTYPKVRTVVWELSFGTVFDGMNVTNTCATQVSKAKIHVEQQPWKRISVDGSPHQHGDHAWFCTSVLEAQLPKLYD